MPKYLQHSYRTGHLSVPGGKVYFEIAGSPKAPSVVIVHGGPGSSSIYLRGLADRLSKTFHVVMYDQLGSGNSDKPRDSALWVISRFVQELKLLITYLDLKEYSVIGHSWGGWLAIEATVTGEAPANMTNLVLYSTSASTRQFVHEANELIGSMNEPHKSILSNKSFLSSDEGSPYQISAMAFYKEHLCRMAPWPTDLVRSGTEEAIGGVYEYMYGPTEFDITGSLKSWDREGFLHLIKCRTLIISGEYDEMTPACNLTLSKGIENSNAVIVEDAAHCAHMERPLEFDNTVIPFLLASY